MNENPFLKIEDDDGKGQMYSKLNEKSELERFRNRYSEEELDDMVERYRSVWTPWFEENMERSVPRHPWKVLKKARREWSEEMNGGDWPSLEMRHSLRVVKDEYTTRWRELAYDD